jgi:cytochrome c oxidase assembly factor CtaG
MGKPDDTPSPAPLGLGVVTLMVALLAILAASAWLAVRTWIATSASPMSTNGYVAMVLGIVVSLIVGCGLMALVFYSSRYGYDDEAYDPTQHRNADRD